MNIKEIIKGLTFRKVISVIYSFISLVVMAYVGYLFTVKLLVKQNLIPMVTNSIITLVCYYNVRVFYRRMKGLI